MESIRYFFSYSRTDSDFVIQLATDLKNAGINVWLDQLDIPPGARWDVSIEQALKEAKCMLVVLSNSSVKSENVLDEVSYAINKGKIVIPLLLHDCEVPFRVARFQRIDFTRDYQKGLQQLLRTLKADQATPSEVSIDADSQEEGPYFRETNKRKLLKPLLFASLAIVACLVLLFVYKKPSGESNQKVSSIEDTNKTKTALEGAVLNTEPNKVPPVTTTSPSDNPPSNGKNKSEESTPIGEEEPNNTKPESKPDEIQGEEAKSEPPKTETDSKGEPSKPRRSIVRDHIKVRDQRVVQQVPIKPLPNEPEPVRPTNRFRVVEVMLRADPFDFTGPCPQRIVFSGRISVAGGSGTVSYKFLRSDGASAPVETLTFDGPGTKDIKTTWDLGGTYSGWQQIQLLDPVEHTSKKAEFKLTCQ